MSPIAKRACPRCGRVLSGEARFCVGCGAELPPRVEPEDAGPEPPGVPAAAETPRAGDPSPAPPLAAEPAPPGPATPQPPAGQPLPAEVVTAGPERGVPEEGPAPSGMVPSSTELTVAHYDRYAGGGWVPPPPPPPPPPQPEAVVAPEPQMPDVNLLAAVRRLLHGTPMVAGAVPGLAAAVVVGVIGLLLGMLFLFAHGSDGCSTGVPVGGPSFDCDQPGNTNGLLTDWNALLWSVQGAGVVFGREGGGGEVVRIPLGLGMLLVAAVLALAGATSMRLLRPRRPRDLAVRAAIVAAAYTAGMLFLGVCIAARGDRLSVGPDPGLALLWCLALGWVGAAAGMSQAVLGRPVPPAALTAARAAVPRWEGIVEAGVVGAAIAFALATVAGLLAAATHVGDVANVLRAALLDVSGRPLPPSAIGTVTAAVYLLLALPNLAAWVLAYSLVIPTDTVGTLFGSADHGLVVGDHDVWLWAAVLVPVAATLLAGHVAARRRRSPTVEAALVDGGLAGLGWAALCFLVIALLEGGGALQPLIGLGGVAGRPLVLAGYRFGPGLGQTLGGLLLWGAAGGAVGGYLSLVLLARGVRLPLLERYEPSPAAGWGPSPPTATRACPRCGAAAPLSARFCPACGAPL